MNDRLLQGHLNRAHDGNVGGDLMLRGACTKIRPHCAHILFLLYVLIHLFVVVENKEEKQGGKTWFVICWKNHV